MLQRAQEVAVASASCGAIGEGVSRDSVGLIGVSARGARVERRVVGMS